MIPMSRPPDPRTGPTPARPKVRTDRRTAATTTGQLGRVLTGGVLVTLCAYLLTVPTVALALAAIVAFLALFVVVPLVLLAASDFFGSASTLRGSEWSPGRGTRALVEAEP
jgi:hypothetical protein